VTDAQTPEPRSADSDRTLAVINYVLLLLALSNGLSAVIAAIIAYIRRDQASALARNHFDFQIRTFWYGLVIFITGFLTIWLLGLGLLIWLGGAVWLVARAVVGLMRLVDGRVHSDPQTFWL